MKEVKTFCRICEPSCALVAEVENSEIVSVKPDRNHPISKGFACHKGLATLDIHRDTDRLSHPLSKSSQGFERVTWDEASDVAQRRLSEIRKKYGNDAIASFAGNPLAFNTLGQPALIEFLKKTGITRNFSSATQDCANKFACSEAIFGSNTIHPIPDIERTHFLLAFGCNPRVSHMSFMSIADPLKSFRNAKKRGAKIRFVDPRINESSAGIGETVLVNPDTDVYLMAAMLNHLDAKNKFDEEFLSTHGNNVEGLRRFIANYPPERVAAVVGISREQIIDLADEFADAESAAVYMSTGVNMGRQGTLAYWLLFMLSAVTGNFDQPGGNYYSRGFYPAAGAGKARQGLPYFDTPFGEVRDIMGFLPGNLMADMILAKESPIKALVVTAGNPLISVGDSSRLREAFQSLELLIVIDLYSSETAELADLVLPATDMYERQDINICGLGMQNRPYVQYTDMVVPPKYERKPEWWIFAKLAQAMGLESVLDHDLSRIYQRPNYMLSKSGLSIESLAQRPDKTELLPNPGPGMFFDEWIQTESGKIDCCPELFQEPIEACEDLFLSMSHEVEDQLKLITRRTNYMINSWFHNIPSLKRKKHLDNPLYMNPDDAEARQVLEDSLVRISSRHGEIVARVSIDSGLKRGTVAMTHGWGHTCAKMQVANKYPGVNVNELLPSGPGSYEKISNQSFMTGIPVKIEACD
ncbi:molybdopterin-dependent oxidoreductase [Pseudomaricurvus alkylphenolicus]|uniref:molybdopterin-containing oxidoreductase family protein n=1 Tax=Pseudomaricurvus alkylphenolicus TaxID=1306991 RepID=UPI0014211A98|nr:molybdopterin-dependent oxidoreductase [Pseudomaricurvus alkylphenolicus]NIB41578.1 molybdopterin-dependent oxidoreductase [Pseudomaricurvus alkylphenolicus]